MPSLVLLAMVITGQSGPPAPEVARTDEPWAHYGRILPNNARIAAIYTITPNARTIVFFSVERPASSARNRSASEGWFAVRDRFNDAGFQDRSWLNGQDCPNLYASLDWLSEIITPSINTGVRSLPAPTWTPRTPPPRPTHGPVHRVEGHGWAPDFDLARVSMSSTSGFLAQWGEATTDMLEDCWSTEQPQF
jgi:hypothetical protein